MPKFKYIFKEEEEKLTKRKVGAPKGTKTSGRKSKKNQINWKMIEKLYYCGLVDTEICELLDITVKTLNEWKKDQLFLKSVKDGKEIADDMVERSLFQRAVGYAHIDSDVKVIDKQIVITPIIKKYPPDTAAATLWLKNRRPDKWRDKQDVEVTGKGGGPVTMKIVYEDKKVQIEGE